MKKQFLFLLCAHILALFFGASAFFGITAWENRNASDEAPTVVKTPKKVIKKTKPRTRSYTITLSNGHKTSSRYAMYQETSSKYCEILNSCPVPLKILTYKEYEKQFISKVVKKYPRYKTTADFAGKNTVGQHVSGIHIEGWPNYFLFVKSRDNPHALMGTYFHELGHYDCNTGKCPHCKAHGHNHTSELHAIMNALEETMRYDCPDIMKASFEKYEGWLCCWKDYQKYQEYGDAVLTIQSSKLWKEIKSYAKKHNIEVPTFKKPSGK